MQRARDTFAFLSGFLRVSLVVAAVLVLLYLSLGAASSTSGQPTHHLLRR